MRRKCRPHPNPLGSVHHHHMRDLYLINLSLPGGIMNSPPPPPEWPHHVARHRPSLSPRVSNGFRACGDHCPCLGQISYHLRRHLGGSRGRWCWLRPFVFHKRKHVLFTFGSFCNLIACMTNCLLGTFKIEGICSNQRK